MPVSMKVLVLLASFASAVPATAAQRFATVPGAVDPAAIEHRGDEPDAVFGSFEPMLEELLAAPPVAQRGAARCAAVSRRALAQPATAAAHKLAGQARSTTACRLPPAFSD